MHASTCACLPACLPVLNTVYLPIFCALSLSLILSGPWVISDQSAGVWVSKSIDIVSFLSPCILTLLWGSVRIAEIYLSFFTKSCPFAFICISWCDSSIWMGPFLISLLIWLSYYAMYCETSKSMRFVVPQELHPPFLRMSLSILCSLESPPPSTSRNLIIVII